MAMVSDVPMVSVIIPCYNMGEFIEETIASVQCQTFNDFEIIVVDDGSDDNETIRLLDTLAAAGIKLLRTVNRGVAAARNTAITAACGRYILPLDADDLIAPDFLEKTVHVLEQQPEIGIVGTDAMLFGSISEIRQLSEFSTKRLLSENLFFATSLFRKSDWQAVGGYCMLMRYGWEDWEFWIAMTKQGVTVARIPEPLLMYRICPESRDRSIAVWQKAAMLLVIMMRHSGSYLKSPGSLVKLIANAKAVRGRMSL